MASNLTFKAQLRQKNDDKNAEHYALEGLSKTFRKEINTLLIKYNFSHQITELTAFDK
jgi:predicted transposase YbfD/YdcC